MKLSYLVVLILAGVTSPVAQASTISSMVYALRGLSDPKQNLLPQSFEACERQCIPAVAATPEDRLDSQRTAFMCRKQAREVCQENKCHLGYQCFTETKELISNDLGDIFGEGICRVRKLNDKRITSSASLGEEDVSDCRASRVERIEFKKTVTEGFAGDKSFYFRQPGKGDAKDVWEAVLRFLDGGMDEAGLVGRGGKSADEKMNMFCKRFKGDSKELMRSTQDAAFDLPMRTFDRMCPFDEPLARHISRSLLHVFSELVFTVSDVLTNKDKLVAHVPHQKWCDSDEEDEEGSVCKYWCRKPRNWDKLAITAKSMLTKFEECVVSQKILTKDPTCTLEGFSDLFDKIEQLRSKPNPFADWYLTASNMMHGCPGKRISSSELSGHFLHGMKGIIGYISDPSATKVPEMDRISAGFAHVCGVTDDGAIECFGAGGNGQISANDWRTGHAHLKHTFPSKPGDLFVQVSAGAYHTCGLTTRGNVDCWGSHKSDLSKMFNTEIDSGFKPPVGKFIQVSAGRMGDPPHKRSASTWGHTCALSDVGAIHCWGAEHSRNHLPDNRCNGYKPKLPIDGVRYLKVSAGRDYTCGLSDEGAIECFGAGRKGPDTRGHVPTSAKPKRDIHQGAQRFTDVSAGSYHTCGVTDVGSILCFDQNPNHGDKGVGLPETTLRRDKSYFGFPKLPESGTKYVRVQTSSTHTCGLTDVGSMECWGSDVYGEANGYRPLVHAQSTHFVQIAVGVYHRTCGLGVDGRIKCQGFGVHGHDNKEYRKPKKGDTFSTISVGERHSCALATDGSVHCKGADGEQPARQMQYTEIVRDFRSTGASIYERNVVFSKLSAGFAHTCALAAVSGGIYCWGNRLETMRSKTQTGFKNWKPSQGARFIDVSAGIDSVCGLSESGAIICYGGAVRRDDNGKPFLPAKVNGQPPRRFTSVSAGSRMVCGVTNIGGVECISDGLGKDGKSSYMDIPPALKGTMQAVERPSGKVVKVSVGSVAYCAIMENGSLRCINNAAVNNGKKNKQKFTGACMGSTGGCITFIGEEIWPRGGGPPGTPGFNKGNKLKAGGRVNGFTDGGDGNVYTDVSVGSAFMACAVTRKGTIECFGDDGNGNTGLYEPHFPEYGEKFVKVSTGASHACGQTDKGNVICWGEEKEGECNNFKSWSPLGHRFAPPGCFMGTNRLNCDMRETGLHLEAGVFIGAEEYPLVVQNGMVIGTMLISILPKEEATDFEEYVKAKSTTSVKFDFDGDTVNLYYKGYYKDAGQNANDAKAEGSFSLPIFATSLLPYAPHEHYIYSSSTDDAKVTARRKRIGSETCVVYNKLDRTSKPVCYVGEVRKRYKGLSKVIGEEGVGHLQAISSGKMNAHLRSSKKRRRKRRNKRRRNTRLNAKRKKACEETFSGQFVHFKKFGSDETLSFIPKDVKFEMKGRLSICYCYLPEMGKRPCHDAMNAPALISTYEVKNNKRRRLLGVPAKNTEEHDASMACKCKKQWWYEHTNYFGCDSRHPGHPSGWCYTVGDCKGKAWKECKLRVDELEELLKKMLGERNGEKTSLSATTKPTMKPQEARSGAKVVLKKASSDALGSTDNANLNGINAVDTALSTLTGMKQKDDGVPDVQYVFKLTAEEGNSFLRPDDLKFNYETKSIEAAYDCSPGGEAQKICARAKDKNPAPASMDIRVYADEHWCCSSTSWDECMGSSGKSVAGGCDLQKTGTFKITVVGTGYDIEEIKGTRRRLLVKARGAHSGS
jgi:alpha-tubulin suppressor-like RCC1 family protein